jgi:hypothetical protein
VAPFLSLVGKRAAAADVLWRAMRRGILVVMRDIARAAPGQRRWKRRRPRHKLPVPNPDSIGTSLSSVNKKHTVREDIATLPSFGLLRQALAGMALAALFAGVTPAIAAPAPKANIASLKELPIVIKKPYDPSADADAAVAAAFAQARKDGKRVLIELGGNWCGD